MKRKTIGGKMKYLFALAAFVALFGCTERKITNISYYAAKADTVCYFGHPPDSAQFHGHCWHRDGKHHGAPGEHRRVPVGGKDDEVGDVGGAIKVGLAGFAGDANKDGIVNVLDGVAIAQVLVGIPVADTANCDVTCNGLVDYADLFWFFDYFNLNGQVLGGLFGIEPGEFNLQPVECPKQTATGDPKDRG